MIFDEFYKHYYTYDVLEKTDIIILCGTKSDINLFQL